MHDEVFDISERLAELRCRPIEWLRSRRDELARQEREIRVERLTVIRALDEREALDRQPDGSVSARTAQAELDVARALEAQPAIAAAAHAGDLSWDQLQPVVELATPETDSEWAQRGSRAAPSDLSRMVRRQRVVTEAEAEARHEARELRWWRSRDGGMLNLRGAIPDVKGALVEEVLEHMINGMKPRRGEPFDSRAHRGADALVELCRTYGKGPVAKTRWTPRVVVHMGSDAQPEVNGIPISLETVQDLIDDGAPVREVFDTDPLAPGTGDAIPAALRDYLKGRDTQCRRAGCECTFGLDAHHIVPRSEGGATDKHNVVLVCRIDHRLLVPQGTHLIEGDPEQPDGLVWRHRDELVLADARGP